MTLRVGLASLLALGMAATPASAATPTTSESETAAQADDNKVVCKGETRANSRFRDKVCRTRAQWEELRIQHQREAKEMVDRPQIDTDRPGRGE